MNQWASPRSVFFMTILALAIPAMWILLGQGLASLPQPFIIVPPRKASSDLSKPLLMSSSSSSSSSSSPSSSSSSSSSLDNNATSSVQGCNFTKVDAFDPRIIKMAKKYPPVDCSKGRPWLVYTNGTHLKVNFSKVKENQKAENFSHCRYRTLTKGTKNDFHCITGQWSKHFNDSISIVNRSVFIETECYDKSNMDISNSYLSNIVFKHETQSDSHISRYVNHLKQFTPKETLSVLFVGADGISQQNMERSLPKTRKYLIHDLGAVELEKYNKVGLNTLPNLLPMLTGHAEDYYNKLLKKPFDEIAEYFLWTEFGKAGYRTALDFEQSVVTAFHYMKKGFFKSPVDFYTRPMTIRLDQNKKLGTEGRYCKGDKPSLSAHNDFLLELATRFNDSFNPYFAFSFMTRFSHDDQNKISGGDLLYLQFLQALKERHALNNTLLIFFSDHGERFGEIRHTYNGIIESKTPVAFIALPDWFKSKYPTEFSLFQKNAGRLTTAFDIHATLRDILYFKSSSPPLNLFPGPGISYFQKLIPETRTCQEAGIAPEFCNCNSLTEVDLDGKVIKYLASVVVKAIANKLGHLMDTKCHRMYPMAIVSILLKKRPVARNKDISAANEATALYRITVSVGPLGGMFETVVELNKETKKASVVGSISRLDLYKGEKDCISDSTIRRFCFCK